MVGVSEESTVDSKEDESEIDLEMPKEEPKGRFRSKMESWTLLPEGHRGIRVCELWDFYGPKKEWLECKRWRCDACHRSCPPDFLDNTSETCVEHLQCFLCEEFATGRFECRNLYEVAAEMIVPACEELQISYVELLRRGSGDSLEGVKPDTFVSHWWGEEFPKFIRALTGFARIRCANVPWTILARKRDYEKWAFWICAFANNQYAIEHALGDFSTDNSPRTAVMTSAFATALGAVDDVVAVLDDQGKIYTRIWCCFELFSVMRLLPERHGKHLEVFIVDESGVVSSGCGNVKMMTHLIDKVKTRDADASNAADKAMIEDAMMADGTTHEDLDDVLQNLAKGGLRAFRSRRCLELYAVASIIVMGIFALCIFAFAFKEEHLPHVEFGTQNATVEHWARRHKVRHTFLNAKDIWLFWFFMILVIVCSVFLAKAAYYKWTYGGTYYNNRGMRLNVRVALVSCCIGLKVGLILAFTNFLRQFLGCWAMFLAVLYCFGFTVLSLLGRNPARRLMDPVFL